MLPYKRSQRVSHLIKEELSEIIMKRVKDPRLGFLTLTDVELTSDLRLARVYISILKEEDRETTMAILEAAKALMRAELAKRLKIKVIPALEFRLDTTAEYGERIEKLLRQIKGEQ